MKKLFLYICVSICLFSCEDGIEDLTPPNFISSPCTDGACVSERQHLSFQNGAEFVALATYQLYDDSTQQNIYPTTYGYSENQINTLDSIRVFLITKKEKQTLYYWGQVQHGRYVLFDDTWPDTQQLDSAKILLTTRGYVYFDYDSLAYKLRFRKGQ